MRRLAFVTGMCAFAALTTLQAQQGVSSLPVRRVLLYKNGIGYFEHVARVRGTQPLSIDFNSSQLNDVLQSLTAIDLGDGRIGNISFNSAAPLAQRIGALPLAVGERATLTDLIGAVRGARVEVRAGEQVLVGRLLNIETKPHGKDAAPTELLSLVTDAGTIRNVDLTPTVAIRLLDRELAGQVSAYLGTIASTRSRDRRRMTFAAIGAGERDVLVSYVSEVPVWKTTYRIVVPSGEGHRPQLQGWAIVDNTIGEDWNKVALSLVAGAPQSFIQQLSQPLYVRRPTVGIAHAATPAPQTHQPTLDALSRFEGVGGGRGSVGNGIGVGEAVGVAGGAAGGVVAGISTGVVSGLGLRVGGSTGGGTIPASQVAAPAAVDRELIEQKLAEMEASARSQNLGDLFEYRVAGPVSIRQNESALVPILTSDVEIERVSLWNDRTGGRPLRSLWLTNSSRLALDGGSFIVLEDAAFAGEGLVDPLKPGEKRLLSYAVDLGTQVEPKNGDEARRIRAVRFARGELIEQSEQRTKRVYTVRNNDATPRIVVLEHAIRPGWSLVGDLKPAETTATAYRFTIGVAPHSTEAVTVEERRELETTVAVSQLTDDRLDVLIRDTRSSAALIAALAPIRATKAELARLATDGTARSTEIAQITTDQQRLRENIRSLKGSHGERALLKRYVAQLNEQEDQLATLTRERDDLAHQMLRAQAELSRLIDALSAEIEL